MGSAEERETSPLRGGSLRVRRVESRRLVVRTMEMMADAWVVRAIQSGPAGWQL